MERESNYPSAKSEASPDTGPSPGQTDVGSDVCRPVFMAGLGNGLLGVLCGIADGPAHITVSQRRLEAQQLLSPGTLVRDGTSQQGMLCCVELELELRQSCAGTKGGG